MSSSRSRSIPRPVPRPPSSQPIPFGERLPLAPRPLELPAQAYEQPRFRTDAMEGRLLTFLLFIALPAVLMAVTVALFHSNPVSILVLIGVMLVGGFYLLSYSESLA